MIYLILEEPLIGAEPVSKFELIEVLKHNHLRANLAVDFAINLKKPTSMDHIIGKLEHLLHIEAMSKDIIINIK